MKGKTRNKIAVKLLIAVLVMSVFLALGSVGTVSTNADAPNEFFSGGKGRYQTDYNSKAESLAAANALQRQVMLEGAVLLKNDNLLPVARNTKVSLLGNAAAFIVPGGGGSAAVNAERILNPGTIADNWFDAFTWDGGFDVNPLVRTFYESTASGPNAGAATTNLNLATSEPTPEMIEGYNGANDLGIVFLSRMGAESSDLNRAVAAGRSRHWLALHEGEERLLVWANSSFQNVVVVINSSNVLEVGFLNDSAYPNIKAAFHVGQPGTQSFYEFPKLLRRDGVSPSARLVNTLNKDFTEDPSYQNFAANTGMNITGGTVNYYVGGSSNSYVGLEYEEGIYLGYRYWETRGYTQFREDGNWDWYESKMNYPFGHGLSYTTFNWEILNSTPLMRDGNVRVQVKVTNTGSVASKDVVQMYYTAPYINGGIEKAHVNLGAFAKTSMLEPDEFDIVTLDMPVRTMASWDYNDANDNDTKGAYEMDPGKYMVSIAKNAHDAAIMAANPSITNPLRIDYDLATTWIYNTDDTTGTPLKNLFEESNRYVMGSAHDDGDLYGIGSQMTVLSRSNWVGTFPTVRTASQNVTADFISTFGATGAGSFATAALLNDTSGTPTVQQAKFRDLDKPYYKTTFPTMGAAGTLRGADLIGVPYDDPMWDNFMDQWTAAQFAQILTSTAMTYNTHAVDGQGIPYTFSSDGPFGFARRGSYVDATTAGGNRQWRRYACLTGAPMHAQTFNVELAYAVGRSTGNEAMWGNGEGNMIQTGWYAPAMNIHRSPFSGRNFEYYGEDGRLGGLIASQIVRGAREKGLVTNIKHFALNDQETNRGTAATWADEQTMREIYFVPFEMSIKVGKSLAVMTAMNRVGTNWSPNDYRLLTELLREQWGHRGIVITDYGVGSPNLMQRAGCGSPMSVTAPNTTTTNAYWTATHAWAIRNAAKDVAYSIVNSNAMQYYAIIGTGATNSNFFGTYANINSSLIKTGNTEAGTGTVNNREIIYKELDALSAGEVGQQYFASVKGASASALVGTGAVDQSVGASNTPNNNGTSSYSASSGAAAGFAATREEADTTWWNLQTVSYSITEGQLPAGLTLNAKTGTISGIPTEGGTFDFTVTASAGTGSQFASSSQEVSIYIVVPDSSDFVYTSRPLAEAIVSGTYEVSVAARDSEGDDYSDTTYAIAATSSLPAGLSLNSATGVISGAPTAAGSTTFTVVATRQVGTAGPVELSANFTITVNALATFNYDQAVASNGRVNQAYSASYAGRIDAGYTTSYGVSAGTLPAGLTLNSETGVISGTPTTAGTYTFTISATGSRMGATTVPVTKEFTVIIHAANVALTVSNFTATAGTVGVGYEYQIVSGLANSTASIARTFTIASGNLPEGLSLNASTGLITGTPTVAGAFDFEVTVSADGLAPVTAQGSITTALATITFDTGATLPGATAGSMFLEEILAETQISTSITFASADLPDGLEMLEITDGAGRVIGVEISGALPAGTYTFTITASANGHENASRTFTLVVSPAAVDPDPGTDPGTTPPEDKGCFGVVTGSSVAVASVILGFAAFVSVRKTKAYKKED